MISYFFLENMITGEFNISVVQNLNTDVHVLLPFVYLFCNRKELVTKRYIKADDDLKLATLIQTKHPKSPETFIQRYRIDIFLATSIKNNWQLSFKPE